MYPNNLSLLLIGYQNDYFAPDGILHSVIEVSSKVTNILANTIALIKQLQSTSVPIISIPIFFTPSYSELIEPVGILQTIKAVGAFQRGTYGSETIPELRQFGDRIVEVPGKRGLNAFSNTDLDTILRQQGITEIVLAGTVTSICIDSTGRSAYELGYKVTILSDCTSARTVFEQDFYCNNIFPLYANVITSNQLLTSLQVVV
ncbi:cysteine hydrolase family protein [Pantanalinema rosaneae CENA516]|uniref:cysteine hydrolase family protein n=1 Tax=Pantanalinema rosaneae TaxID=1620701 RepID=UPI003D6FC5D4